MSALTVILAGGSGTRLWPISRSRFPKQFHRISDMTYSMLQLTCLRVKNIPGNTLLVICHEEHRFIAAQQVQEIAPLLADKKIHILLEPEAKNTAPSIALAANWALQRGIEKPLLVLPADHLILDEPAFHHTVIQSLDVLTDQLLTFGVTPTVPHTAYGYIAMGDMLTASADTPFYRVDAFVEKPDIDTARDYLVRGNYVWNSGMFMFYAHVYLSELSVFAPDMHHACAAAMQTLTEDMDFERIQADQFSRSPSGSIDYVIMEKTQRAAVVSLAAQWSDVGSWDALWETQAKDAAGNVLKGDIEVLDCRDNIIYARSRFVAALGVSDLAIIETKDAVYVSPKNQSQEIKQLVEGLLHKQRREVDLHREVYRPWGRFDSLGCGDTYQVKHICVHPGARLSLQKHRHRAEHWVVVKGQARVTNGDKVFILHENESTFIPKGVVHCLENPGADVLEIIEVQSGSYLGEDDIVRLDDIYGRH